MTSDQFGADAEEPAGSSEHVTPPAHVSSAPFDQAPIAIASSDAAPVADLLAEHMATLGPGHDLVEIRRGIEFYLTSARRAAGMLTEAASETESPAGLEVTRYLRAYLAEGNDLIPDHHGAYGIIDDAWLILNTTFWLIEGGVLAAEQVPINWAEIVVTDPVVRHLMPAGVLPILEGQLRHLLRLIAAEMDAYQPWMSPGSSANPSPGPPDSALRAEMDATVLGTSFSL